VLQGVDVFRRALADPESLASTGYFKTCERLLYAAQMLWDRRHPDRGMPLRFRKKSREGTNPITSVDQLKQQFPKLVEAYWGKWPGWSPYRERGLV
jgi:hypothetical protein